MNEYGLDCSCFIQAVYIFFFNKKKALSPFLKHVNVAYIRFIPKIVLPDMIIVYYITHKYILWLGTYIRYSDRTEDIGRYSRRVTNFSE